jgi:ankyrin repeat protein
VSSFSPTPNQDGSTALIEAAQRGHASMVTLLLSTSAGVNHANNVSIGHVKDTAIGSIDTDATCEGHCYR